MKQEKKHIAFWIIFPILFLLVGALSLFYLDLANGPVILFIIEIILLVGLAIGRIATHTGKKRWMLLWLVYFAANAAMFPFAKPSAVPFRAYSYKDPKPTEVLTLHDGKVQGLKSQDGKIEVYAGIPYAAAPIGDLRWKEPQDVKPWDGVRDASYFAARSMQPVSNAVIGTLTDIYSAKSWHPNWNMEPLQNRSEDSLYLNVWRPATINEKLPILVFIHGGSLTTGSSAFFEYNGEALARQGIIMITITYRLGVFGYFAHPDLKAESPNGTTGNYGLLDQIKALEWVQENADYFGGDKTKVTIAGESAGSSSISALCTSPLAKGLFRYAIGESSSLVLKHVPHTYRSQEKA
jgi:para-nitrobenzyl esterase